MSAVYCGDCLKPIDPKLLSGLGTCPSCVNLWVKNYRSLHDRRYGKRVKR